MADIINLYAESDRNIIGDDSTPVLKLENSSTGNALSLQKDVSGGATIAVLRVSSSTASGPAFELAGSCVVSTASAAATYMAGVRVKFGDAYGWIPVFPAIA